MMTSPWCFIALNWTMTVSPYFTLIAPSVYTKQSTLKNNSRNVNLEQFSRQSIIFPDGEFITRLIVQRQCTLQQLTCARLLLHPLRSCSSGKTYLLTKYISTFSMLPTNYNELSRSNFRARNWLVTLVTISQPHYETNISNKVTCLMMAQGLQGPFLACTRNLNNREFNVFSCNFTLNHKTNGHPLMTAEQVCQDQSL